MRLVVDSSVAITAALSSVAWSDLVEHDLAAPPLLWSEVHSALHNRSWRGEMSRSQLTDALERFRKLPVARRIPRRMYEVAVEIAADLGWAKTYDAEFLALAALEDRVVLTVDARLRRGADRTGLVIGPAEL